MTIYYKPIVGSGFSDPDLEIGDIIYKDVATADLNTDFLRCNNSPFNLLDAPTLATKFGYARGENVSSINSESINNLGVTNGFPRSYNMTNLNGVYYGLGHNITSTRVSFVKSLDKGLTWVSAGLNTSNITIESTIYTYSCCNDGVSLILASVGDQVGLYDTTTETWLFATVNAIPSNNYVIDSHYNTNLSKWILTTAQYAQGGSNPIQNSIYSSVDGLNWVLELAIQLTGIVGIDNIPIGGSMYSNKNGMGGCNYRNGFYYIYEINSSKIHKIDENTFVNTEVADFSGLTFDNKILVSNCIAISETGSMAVPIDCNGVDSYTIAVSRDGDNWQTISYSPSNFSFNIESYDQFRIISLSGETFLCISNEDKTISITNDFFLNESYFYSILNLATQTWGSSFIFDDTNSSILIDYLVNTGGNHEQLTLDISLNTVYKTLNLSSEDKENGEVALYVKAK